MLANAADLSSPSFSFGLILDDETPAAAAERHPALAATAAVNPTTCAIKLPASSSAVPPAVAKAAAVGAAVVRQVVVETASAEDAATAASEAAKAAEVRAEPCPFISPHQSELTLSPTYARQRRRRLKRQRCLLRPKDPHHQPPAIPLKHNTPLPVPLKHPPARARHPLRIHTSCAKCFHTSIHICSRRPAVSATCKPVILAVNGCIHTAFHTSIHTSLPVSLRSSCI